MKKRNDIIEDNKAMKLNHYTINNLWFRIKSIEAVKYQRWYHNQSYFRFRIYETSFMIIVSPSYEQFPKNPPEFSKNPIYNDGYSWVINATKWYGNVEDIVETVVDMYNWWVDFYTQEEMLKMAEFADADNIDYKAIGYDYIMKPDGAFSISHSDAMDKMADDLAKRYISHLKLEDNRFGALFEIMRVLARIIFDCTIDEKERQQYETK